MCIAFLIIAKDCDTCIYVFGQSPVDRMSDDTCIFCLAILGTLLSEPCECTCRFQNENKNK
jgi:hypothetical protein